MELESRITELETRLAFQESTLQQLSELLADKQQQMEAMQTTLDELQLRFREMMAATPGATESDETPPHY